MLIWQNCWVECACGLGLSYMSFIVQSKYPFDGLFVSTFDIDIVDFSIKLENILIYVLNLTGIDTNNNEKKIVPWYVLKN